MNAIYDRGRSQGIARNGWEDTIRKDSNELLQIRDLRQITDWMRKLGEARDGSGP
jgi:hypothetical protein